jgi:hypothetical protein
MGVQFLWKGGPNIWVIVVYGYAGYQGSSDGQAQQTQLLEDIRVHIDQYCRKEDVVLCVGDFNQELEDSRGDHSLHAWAAGCGLGHGASGMTQIPEWFSFMQTGKEGKVRKSLIDHIWTSGEAVAVTQYLISESFLCSDHCLLRIVMEGGGLKCRQVTQQRVEAKQQEQGAFAFHPDWDSKKWQWWREGFSAWEGKWERWVGEIDNIPATEDDKQRETVRRKLDHWWQSWLHDITRRRNQLEQRPKAARLLPEVVSCEWGLLCALKAGIHYLQSTLEPTLEELGTRLGDELRE